MASNLILVVFIVFVSLSLTSVYSLSTRNAVSKQDGESYVMNQESSVVVEDVVKGRLLARVARSEVVVNNIPSFLKRWPFPWPRKGPKKKTPPSPKKKEPPSPKKKEPPSPKKKEPPSPKRGEPSPPLGRKMKDAISTQIGTQIGKKIKKIGSLSIGAFVGVIIAAIVGFIGIIIGICFLLGCCFFRKAKKAQSAAEAEQETATDKTNDSSKPQTSKTEDV